MARRYSGVKLSKSYGGPLVLDGVDLELVSGEIHGLVGQNGSGKSTLISILTGVIPPTHGCIEVDGKRVAVASPADALRLGVAGVFQDNQLFADLDVATNVIGVGAAGQDPFRLINRTHQRTITKQILTQLQVSISPDELVRNLGPSERKAIEIARALHANPSMLILDEPTASMDRRESTTLLSIVRRLAEQHIGVLFVSHRLDEVFEATNRITVLRDGKRVGLLETTRTSLASLVELVAGKEAPGVPLMLKASEGRRLAISLSGLRVKSYSRPVNVDIRRGEILGLTGLLGSGASEVVQMLGGRLRLRGAASRDGRPLRLQSTRDALRAGIGYLSSERKELGLIPSMSVEMNICLSALSKVSKVGILRPRSIRGFASRYQQQLSIRTRSLTSPIDTLSGGNQQKAVLARLLLSNARVLAIEEPTQGVDVAAKHDIHELLREFAKSGGTVVFASTDVSEVLSLANRVIVFRDGAIVGLLDVAVKSRERQVMGAQHGHVSPELLAALVEGSGNNQPSHVH